MNKIWTQEEIKTLLQTNDKAVCNGVKALYNLQTQQEQLYKTTKSRNNVGFNALDSELLSNIAIFYIKNKFLTKKQIYVARIKIMKYSKQLTKIANKELYNEKYHIRNHKV